MELRLSLSGEKVVADLAEKFQGVGLIRGEYLMRIADQYITLAPCQEIVYQYLDAIAETFAPKSVWYRTSELWSDEANTLEGIDQIVHENNPIMGLRGLRRAMKYPDAFELELRVVTEVARKHDNLHVLFPYVGDADEFAYGVSVLKKLNWPNRIGSMLEIPSAILEANDFIAAGASNLLLGFNDLTCLLTGANRNSGFDDKNHRALWWCVDHVARQIGSASEWGLAGNLPEQVIQEAQRREVPYVSIHYGELPAVLHFDPQELPDLSLVRQTKVKTKKSIAALALHRTLQNLGLDEQKIKELKGKENG